MNTMVQQKGRRIDAMRFFIGREEIKVIEPITPVRIEKLFERIVISIDRFGIKKQPLIVTDDEISINLGDNCKINFGYMYINKYEKLCPTIHLSTPPDLEIRIMKLSVYRDLDKFIKEEVSGRSIGNKLKRFFKL